MLTPTLPEEVFFEDDAEVLHDDPVQAPGLSGYQPGAGVHSTDEEDDATEPAADDTPSLRQPASRLPPDGKLERLHVVHRRLGHPPNETLVRMLQLGGASEDMVELAKHLECPTCKLAQPPRRPFPARADSRAVSFGLSLHVDLKYVSDFKGGIYVAISMVDEATTFHAAKLLRNRTPEHTARKFLSGWVAIHGTPRQIVLDQGGEFESDFVATLEQHAIHSKITGSHSPWQHGYAERHGALLGTAWEAIIAEQQCVGRAQMKASLACALQAKNAVVSRAGHSAHYLVYGRQALFPDLLDDDVFSAASLGHALSIDTEVARLAEMRAAAKVALLRGDIREKIKRALRRAPAGERRAFVPGELVYFWSPHDTKKARYKKDTGVWRGPAVILVPDGQERYFASWRGRCLLLGAANIKSAGREEPTEEFHLDQEELAKGYTDLTESPPPPAAAGEGEAPFAVQGPGLRPRRRQNGLGRTMTEARKMMAGLKSVKRLMEMPFAKQKRRRLLGLRRERPPRGRDHPEDREPEPSELPPGEASELPGPSSVPEAEDLWYNPRPRPRDPLYDPLDDVPVGLRKRFREAEEAAGDVEYSPENAGKRLRTTEFANFVLTAVCEERESKPNEWLPRKEIAQLGRLLDLPLAAARVHRAPRKRLQHPGPRGSKRRITMMLGEDPDQVMIADESAAEVDARPRRKCPHLWRGLSLLLKRDRSHLKKGELKEARRLAQKLKSATHTVYVAKENQVFSVQVLNDDLVQAAFADLADNVLCQEVFLLKMKASGKELDPRFFSDEEKAAFDASDQKEWKAWLDNKVVQLLSPEEAKRVPLERIFKVPARVVRTNKAGPGDARLSAKSRIVLPGHLDPDSGAGLVRTDSPTTTMTAVRMAMAIALTRGWKCLLFDVSTAFLSGKPVNRNLYCRPPNDLKVGPAALWRILKSAYGLSEAPRLWYMQACELLKKCGFQEVPFAPATFIKFVVKDGRRRTVAILCLHVDDGFLAVEAGKEATQTRAEIDNLFSIKEWIAISEKPVAFLGMKICIVQGHFINDMSEYIQNLEPSTLSQQSLELKLDGPGLKDFRRLIAQIRWPVHLVLPELLYRVSDLAQRVGRATWRDLGEANLLLKDVKAAAEQGRACLRVRPFRGDPILVSFFDAALGKTEDPVAQRGEAHFLAEKSAATSQGAATLFEFHSNKVSRVVRSSLAAECCSMSSAADRLVYNMKLLDALLHAEVEVPADWRHHLLTQGYLVTDARSVFDHVHGSSQLATERQTSLDILAVRQMVQQDLLKLSWVPTWRQYADSLTKAMDEVLFYRFRQNGSLNLVESPADAAEEQRRAGLRRAQRERRKQKLKSLTSTR